MPELDTPKPDPERSAGKVPAISVLLLGTFLTFVSTFKFGWVYDDVSQIAQNQTLQWKNLPFLLTHHLWVSSAGVVGRFYRPLLTIWFLLNKSLFGLNPHGFHFTTVLAHATAAVLAFLIAFSLLKNNATALFTAAIFALHPIQVESSSWVSAVNDPLAAVLCFGSFLAFRKARMRRQQAQAWGTLAGVLFLLALFTKEVSIVLPGIILIDLWADPLANSESAASEHQWRTAVFTYLPIALFWLALRSWVLRNAAAPSSAPYSKSYLLTVPKIILFNLFRILLPYRLSPHYNLRLVQSARSPEFLFGLTGVAILVLFAVAAAKRNSRIWISLAWLILPTLPTLNLSWMNEDDFVHDRYLYMSMLGVSLLAGYAYAWTWRKWPQQKLVPVLAVLLVVALALASAIQSQYWSNNVILFSRAVAIAPHNEWAQLNYGSALSAKGRYQEAAPHFAESYILKPEWRAADFAGFAYQQSGDLASAEKWFATALRQDSGLATAWFGMAQIRLAQNRPDEAIPYLRKALQIAPAADGFHYAMGSALEQISQRARAIEEYKMELQLHPYQTGARKALERMQKSDLDQK